MTTDETVSVAAAIVRPVRADRLVSLVLLLRQHGRLPASRLAAELEVSTRTVQRDVDALSAAGVPVYAERGRYGGFALLPGLRTELTGLTHDEALALLVAGSRRGVQTFGLGPALATAVLKVADALPADQRTRAADLAGRLLVDPTTDLLERPVDDGDDVPAAVLDAVRRGVVTGRRLRLRYRSRSAGEETPVGRTVDPVGLVSVRGAVYLLAEQHGVDRTYRLSRVAAAEVLPEPAVRPAQVDLPGMWRERGRRFRRGGDVVTAVVRVAPDRRDQLLATAVEVVEEGVEPDGRLRVEAVFQDHRHAVWAVWQLGADAEAVAPPSLRAHLAERATALAERYRVSAPGLDGTEAATAPRAASTAPAPAANQAASDGMPR